MYMYVQLLFQVLLFDEASNGNRLPNGSNSQTKKTSRQTSQKTPQQQMSRLDAPLTTQSTLKQTGQLGETNEGS